MQNTPPKIVKARIDRQTLTVELETGITIAVPLEHYPTLLLATDQEREEMEIGPCSLHWETLDCDLGIEGLLVGAKEMPGLALRAWQRFFARQYPDKAA